MVWRRGLATASVGGGRSRASARQKSHAISPRHQSTQAQKPRNPNNLISKPEIHSGELHAKLLIAHVNPMTCVWAAPPRCMSRGLRAYQRVYVQVSELTCDLSGEHSGYWLTCEHMHRARHLCAQNADHLAHNTPFSAFFTEVVCVLSAAPPQAATSQPQNGGNDAIQASDTPATRRQRASHDAKPPLPHSKQAAGLANTTKLDRKQQSG